MLHNPYAPSQASSSVVESFSGLTLLTMGQNQRSLSLAGELVGSTLTLTDPTTGLRLQGTLTGDTLTGWSARNSSRKRTDWSATRQ